MKLDIQHRRDNMHNKQGDHFCILQPKKLSCSSQPDQVHTTVEVHRQGILKIKIRKQSIKLLLNYYYEIKFLSYLP